MAWKIEWDDRALAEMKKLAMTARRRIIRYLDEQIALSNDPRKLGKPLSSLKSGLRRYRVGDCRIITKIEDKRFVVLIIRVGHRKDVHEQ